MNKIFKLLSVLLALIIVSSCVASFHAVSIYTDGDYSYADIDADHVALYDYTGDSSVLVVPEYFSGRIISEVYSYAFEENKSITAIDFSENPNHITYIGTKAFAECTGLTGSLSLPSSLKSMGFAAFQGCTSLQSLTINVGIHVIPEQCFNRCSSLQVVYLPSDLESIERLAFGNCSYLNKVYIPSSVTYINEYAFTNSNPTLYVYNNSYAHQFAIDNGYSYVVIDPPQPEPTEEPTEKPTTAPTDAPTEPIAPTESPTVKPTQQPTEAAGYYLGDVNGNHIVNVVDSTLIQRHLSSIAYPDTCVMSHGDVDGDGHVTILDATFIARYNAKIDVKYPIGEWRVE